MQKNYSPIVRLSAKSISVLLPAEARWEGGTHCERSAARNRFFLRKGHLSDFSRARSSATGKEKRGIIYWYHKNAAETGLLLSFSFRVTFHFVPPRGGRVARRKKNVLIISSSAFPPFQRLSFFPSYSVEINVRRLDCFLSLTAPINSQ